MIINKVNNNSRAEKFKRDVLSVFFGIFISVFLISLTLIINHFYNKSREIEERLHVLSGLSVIRAKLEGSLISRLLLVKGLVSYVSINPDINPDEFNKYSGSLIGNDSIIKNISLLKNTTIIYAYPYKGNEKAIGIDLSKIPGQAETVNKAIETRETVIAGPVKLVQGGMGIISRIPIFIKSPNAENKDSYWGQASTVIMEDALLKEAGLTDSDQNFKFAIRGENGSGKKGRVFWGDHNVFTDNPVTLDVYFPNGTWQLAAVPVKGWGGRDFFSYLFLSAGFFISLVIGVLLWSLLRTRYALKDLAYHDALTGLPNRSLFADRFSLAVVQAKRTGKSIAIMMLDLNKFKQVNDEMGHSVGDILLGEIAVRLTVTLRESDTVVRFGGDEFIIMLQDISEPYVITEIESKIIKVFSDPFQCAGKKISIGTSIGTAVYPVDGNDMETLLKKADTLMYASKKGRNYSV